jgi:hypothetical protein
MIKTINRNILTTEFAGDDSTAYINVNDSTLVITNYNTNEKNEYKIPTNNKLDDVFIVSGDGRYFIFESELDEKKTIFDKETLTLQLISGRKMEFSHDSKFIYYISHMSIMSFNIETSCIKTLCNADGLITAFRVSNNNKLIAYTLGDTLYLVKPNELTNCKLKPVLYISKPIFTPNNEYIIMCCSDSLKIYNTKTNQVSEIIIKNLVIHISADDEFIYYYDFNDSFIVWSLSLRKIVYTMPITTSFNIKISSNMHKIIGGTFCKDESVIYALPKHYSYEAMVMFNMGVVAPESAVASFIFHRSFDRNLLPLIHQFV